MPAKTDLTWAEWETYHDGSFLAQINRAPDPTTAVDHQWFIDIGAILGEPVRDIRTQEGVVKVLAKCLEVAKAAQDEINKNRVAGERLAAFPAPTIGNQLNGYVPVTRAIASRSELGSVTSIIGATA